MDKTAKLLWIVQNFPPSVGGVQQYVYNYVYNMQDGNCIILTRMQGHEKKAKEVDFGLGRKQHVVLRSNSVPNDLGFLSIVHYPLKFLSFITSLSRIIKKYQITCIIFGHSSFFYLFALPLIKLISNVPVICIFHGEDIPAIHMRSNSLYRYLINRLDKYICNSNFTQQRLQSFLGRQVDAFIAYPGVTEKFFEKLDREEGKKKFGVAGRKVIYTVGRLDERKGHDLVIKALPSIIKRVSNVIYLIGGEGPYLPKLQHLVKQLALQDYVRFCGFIGPEEMLAFHHTGDIFVMPNRILPDGDTEGFGIVFLEAGATGRPVIGGRAGGAVDAIVDGTTGFLVDPYSPEELIQKTVALLKNETLAIKLGEQARSRAWNQFRWKILATKFLEYLRNEL